MDPITQRILDQQRAITSDPNFSGYEPSNVNGIAAINTAPVNENITIPNTFVEQTPPIDIKQMVKNVGKNLVTDYAIKKLGIDGFKGKILKKFIGGNNFMGFSNPLTAAFTVGSLLPDSVQGIAAVLRNKRAQKSIERDIARDMQGKITTSNPSISNMQPSPQDIYRGGGGGGGGSPGPKTTSTKSTSKTQSRHTAGSGGLHSGY